MTKLKAKTATACEIASVNAQRFNEAVNAELYPCAPPTKRGASRVFDLQDIIALWVYGCLTEEGLPPRSAGEVACDLRDLLRQQPDIEDACHVRKSIGSSEWHGPNFDRAATRLSGLEIVSVREWRFGSLRQRIALELEEEATHVGRDD